MEKTRLWQLINNWGFFFELLELSYKEKIDIKELLLCAKTQNFDIYNNKPMNVLTIKEA